MGLLLGSTNKAEVLEAMEFFRVAWEYQFDSAEVRPFIKSKVCLILILAYVYAERHQEDVASHLVERQ